MRSLTTGKLKQRLIGFPYKSYVVFDICFPKGSTTRVSETSYIGYFVDAELSMHNVRSPLRFSVNKGLQLNLLLEELFVVLGTVEPDTKVVFDVLIPEGDFRCSFVGAENIDLGLRGKKRRAVIIYLKFKPKVVRA